MKVVPVPFSTEGKNILIHTKELLEFETPIVAIDPKFEKLTTSLRTAISDDLGKLDKEATSYDISFVIADVQTQRERKR